MVTIGGKTKRPKAPSGPQVVIKLAEHLNEFALLGTDSEGKLTISWIGDPNAATKFDSKYAAKTRVRDIEEVPATRVFHTL